MAVFIFIVKGGEVMDSGAGYHLCSFKTFNYIKRGIYHEQRYFVKLLQQRQFKAVRSILDVMNEVDIASLLSELNDKELALAFRLIPKDKAAEVFANMESSMQTNLVEMFSEKELRELLDDLYMDDTVDLLEELPANLVNRILDTVSPEDRALINQLLNYPEDSAGSIMTTEYVDIRETMTVAEAMAHIRNRNPQGNDLYMLCHR